MAECPGCVFQSSFTGWKILLKSFYQRKSPFAPLRFSSSEMHAWHLLHKVLVALRLWISKARSSQAPSPSKILLWWPFSGGPKICKREQMVSKLSRLLSACFAASRADFLLLLGQYGTEKTGCCASKEMRSEEPILGAVGIGRGQLSVSSKQKEQIDCA